jgi:hypothetical protein
MHGREREGNQKLECEYINLNLARATLGSRLERKKEH